MTTEKEVLGRKLAQMVAQDLVSWIIETTGEEWPCTPECWLCRQLYRKEVELKPLYRLECPRPPSMSESPPCYNGEDWKQAGLEPPTIKIELPAAAEVIEAG